VEESMTLENIMRQDDTARLVSAVFWPDSGVECGRELRNDKYDLVYISQYFGDHSENWILQLDKQGNEICRHNVRFVETVQWVTP
jgi:hypothetical protein